MADVNAPLSADEFESLRQLSYPNGRGIPDAHKATLKQFGFIDQKLGGWVLTTSGQARLSMGR
jgi:hypothetical protein